MFSSAEDSLPERKGLLAASLSLSIIENKGFMGWVQKNLMSFQPWDQLMTLTAQKTDSGHVIQNIQLESLEVQKASVSWAPLSCSCPRFTAVGGGGHLNHLSSGKSQCYQTMTLLWKNLMTSSKQHLSLHRRREWLRSSALHLSSSIFYLKTKKTPKDSTSLMQKP